MKLRHSWLLAAWLVLPVFAAEQKPPDPTVVVTPTEDFRSFTVFSENDLYTLGTKSDRYYTTGQKFTWMSRRVCRFEQAFESAWTKFFTEPATKQAEQKAAAENQKAKRPFLSPTPPALQMRAAVSLGQSMFTPADLHTPLLQTNDRPYAAWLYLSAALQARSVSDPCHASGNRDWLTVWGADVGAVGPAALGKTIQDFVHDNISRSPRAQGWAHQLRNEPGLNLFHQTKVRWTAGHRKQWAADAIAHAGFSIGNVATYLNGGGAVRFGYGLPDDFGIDIIRSGADTSQAGGHASPWGAHLFAGFDVRAVGRDISLDGNTFARSHHVAREVFVGDFQFGAALTFWRWTLSLSQVRRTPEFKLQGNAQAYGSITLSLPISDLRKLTR